MGGRADNIHNIDNYNVAINAIGHVNFAFDHAIIVAERNIGDHSELDHAECFFNQQQLPRRYGPQHQRECNRFDELDHVDPEQFDQHHLTKLKFEHVTQFEQQHFPQQLDEFYAEFEQQHVAEQHLDDLDQHHLDSGHLEHR